jgi:sporulation protein YlmC with PRC-barrel domain/stress response protein YsnF
MKYTDDMPDRLHELNGSNFEIAKGQEDITGWDVKDSKGYIVGKVDDLVFDKESLKVRYLILKLKKDKDLGIDKSRKVLIPIGMAQLDREDDEVYLQNVNIDRLNSLPDYDKDMLNREMETRTYNTATGRTVPVATGDDFYNNDYYNDTNLYKNRRDRTAERINEDINRNTEHIADRDRRPIADWNNEHIRERDTEHIAERNAEDVEDRNIKENKNGETTIPVIEESMEVGKKVVERGGIRIRQRVVEKPVEENINLREEHIKVDRKNVDRPATDSDFNANDQDIEIREHAEVPVVSKEARVVEEIKITKEVTNRDEKVKDTIRKTQVDVDDLKDKK